jgi:tyrosyl-tRNA synthetase
VEGNPLLDWIKWIIFPINKEVIIPGDEKWNTEEKKYLSYQELEDDYRNEKFHPNDLKKAMTGIINSLLEPIRNHFKDNINAKHLLSIVKNYKKK